MPLLENKLRLSYDDTVASKTMSIKDYYAKSIFYFFTAVVFLTPLIFTTNTKELFEFPKMHFVYAVGTTIIFLFVLKKIIFEERVKLPGTLILLFAAGYTVSTLFSSHTYTSVWGYYSRFNGGLFSVFVFIGLYIVLINEFNRSELLSLVKFSVFTLVPISLYSVGQHFQITANLWKGSPEFRSFSTFGQPNWLAAYIAMLLPVCLNFILKTEKSSERLLWSIVFAGGFSGFWFSYSLSGVLGLLAGLTVLAILIRKPLLAGKIDPANLKAVVIVFTVCLVIIVAEPGPFKNRVDDALVDFRRILGGAGSSAGQPAAPDTAIASHDVVSEDPYNVSDPGAIRKGLWVGTIHQVISQPKIFLIGTGPETYPYEFQQFRPKELNYTSEWDFVFNKPHNYYLELLSTAGIFTAVVYILLIFKSLNSGGAVFAPALTALYVTNIFSWPTVSTALLFWLFLAGMKICQREAPK